MTYEQIIQSVAFIRTKSDLIPSVGIITGTGLNSIINHVKNPLKISYQDIPNFVAPTVSSHKGELVIGLLNEQPVVILSGRFHYYEGYSMKQVTFPVRVLKMLGATSVIMTNVAGGLNPSYQAGDIVMVRDHINLQPENPLRGNNDDRLGPRFPDMLHTYNQSFIEEGLDFCQKKGVRAHTGVYLALQGPNLETPAEYQFFHDLGADLVGMSTVPEVIVAKHMDMKIAVLSLVSNQCYPIESIRETTIESVLEVAKNASPKIENLILHLIEKG